MCLIIQVLLKAAVEGTFEVQSALAEMVLVQFECNSLKYNEKRDNGTVE